MEKESKEKNVQKYLYHAIRTIHEFLKFMRKVPCDCWSIIDQYLPNVLTEKKIYLSISLLFKWCFVIF